MLQKDPLSSTKRIQAKDPWEAIDLGDGTIKRTTYISSKIDPSLRTKIIKVMKEFKDYFAWDYDEMSDLVGIWWN